MSFARAQDRSLDFIKRVIGIGGDTIEIQDKKIFIKVMTKENIKFTAIKTVKKPVTVEFKTKTGEVVSFKAIKTVERKEIVNFRAKKK